MTEQREKKPFVPFLGNIVLFFVGLVIALGMAEILLRAFPNWVPSEVRVNPPARRVKALIDESYDLRLSDGDLYYYMRGEIAPVAPDQDRVIAHVHMVTDEQGFRNSLPEQDNYEIVALGDSFTRASGAATPWPQKLAEHLGSNVLNLSDVGFGPQDELRMLQQYGVGKQPQLVIMAYFEGNDLYDAASYDQANPFILLRFGRYVLGKGLEAWQAARHNGNPKATPSTYRYPITIQINAKELEMAFFSSYISWLSLDRQTMERSQNYRLVGETILQVQELSESTGAQFLLVYLPSKSHVYLPYLKDDETIESIFSAVPGIDLNEEGFLQFTQERVTYEETRLHIDDQARLMADFAAEHNIPFLNLTQSFQEEAAVGAELYHPFDTHWNQNGHNLAAEVIYTYIQDMLPLTSHGTAGPQ